MTFPPQGRLGMSGDIFAYYHWGRGATGALVARGHIVLGQCTAQPPEKTVP